MRHEQQRWDNIIVGAELVNDGVALTGKSVSCKIKRRSDGLWLQADGSWGASAAALGMTEVDDTDQAGRYEYDVPTDSLDYAAGRDGYSVTIAEATTPALEHLEILPVLVGGAPEGNVRVVYTAWTSKGQPTAGYRLFYDTAEDMEADESPWALASSREDFTSTYSGEVLQQFEKSVTS
jgi:hypothetical protein